MTADHDKLREGLWERTRRIIDGPHYEGAGIVAISVADLRALLAAAESTLPKTKMVEVWHVEFAQTNPHGVWEAASASFQTRYDADVYERTVKKWPNTACVRVTAHQQEVPQ